VDDSIGRFDHWGICFKRRLKGLIVRPGSKYSCTLSFGGFGVGCIDRERGSASRILIDKMVYIPLLYSDWLLKRRILLAYLDLSNVFVLET
jgi:hypothetical protein